MSKALSSQLSAGRGHGFCGFLCQWLCECHVCLRGFLASYKGPQAEVTSEGGAGSGNLCGHARQVASENRMFQWTPPVEERAATSVSVESSRCACLTPQLRIRSAAFTPAAREQSLPLIG